MRNMSAVLMLMFAALVPAAAAARPQTLEVSGTTLVLTGHGTRTELFFIELYSVALYLPRPMSDPQTIQNPQVVKALRLEIRYGSLPNRIPESWGEELLPALTDAQARSLRTCYRQLRQHDVVTISYAPAAGTTVAVNGEPIINDAGKEVMNAFLDLWIGHNPVSEELKQALL